MLLFGFLGSESSTGREVTVNVNTTGVLDITTTQSGARKLDDSIFWIRQLHRFRVACFCLFVVRQTSEVNQAVRDRGQQRVLNRHAWSDSDLKKLVVGSRVTIM